MMIGGLGPSGGCRLRGLGFQPAGVSSPTASCRGRCFPARLLSRTPSTVEEADRYLMPRYPDDEHHEPMGAPWGPQRGELAARHLAGITLNASALLIASVSLRQPNAMWTCPMQRDAGRDRCDADDMCAKIWKPGVDTDKLSAKRLVNASQWPPGLGGDSQKGKRREERGEWLHSIGCWAEGQSAQPSSGSAGANRDHCTAPSSPWH